MFLGADLGVIYCHELPNQVTLLPTPQKKAVWCDLMV